MRKTSIIFLATLLFTLISQTAFSQKQANNWVFGSFGLEFKSNEVLTHTNYASYEDGGAAGIISDKNGNLLCYSDGLNVWNKNHQIMPNGKNIITVAPRNYDYESIIIPKPNSETEFYLFTADALNVPDEGGFYYSIIDLSKENGLGDVTLKGKKILTNTTNKITAVYHKNGKDVWIITNQYDTKNYLAYLLTESGLNETPVVSAVNFEPTNDTFGQMKASPDGAKIATTQALSFSVSFSLFDFDNATGKLSNPLDFTLPDEYESATAIEFSSDATKLFVFQLDSYATGGLYQFDITSGDFQTIDNSRFFLFRDSYYGLNQMQLAPNGKIYFTPSGGQTGGVYLGVIENPNEYGINCEFVEFGFLVPSKVKISQFTPNFIQNYFFKTSFTSSNLCSGRPTNFQITNEIGLDSVKWDFGEGSSSTLRNPQFSYSESGDYTVTLIAHYPSKIDTIHKTIHVNQSPLLDLGEDKSVCYGYELSAQEGYSSYLWNTGDKTRTIIVEETGNYKLTVTNEAGCETTDSVYLTIIPLPEIALSDSIYLGTQDSVLVTPGTFKSYKWSTGETSASIYIKNVGWYSVTVENEAGCIYSKSFYVYSDKQEKSTDEWQLLNPQPSAYNALNVHFLNSQLGYILNTNQILTTTNGGNTWNVLQDITPTAKKMAFKGNCGYIIGNKGNKGILYKSTDMGYGWNELNTNAEDGFLSINFIGNDTLIITGNTMLHTSFDGGVSWTSSMFPEYVSVLSSCFVSATEGHIGYSNGNVYKTIDGGKTWVQKSSNNTSSSSINKIYFVNDSVGFIPQGYRGDILATADRGETWSKLEENWNNSYLSYFIDSQYGYKIEKNGVIFQTTSGGASWNRVGFLNGKFVGEDINDIHFIDSRTGVAVGAGGRILKTTDNGLTWSNYSITYDEIRKIDIASETTFYAQAGNSFIKTTDSGKSWINVGAPNSSGSTYDFDFVDENVGYAIVNPYLYSSQRANKIYKTTDGGASWSVTNGGNSLFYNALFSVWFIDENTGFASGYENTFKTTDGGATWVTINDYSFYQMKFLTPMIGYGRTWDEVYKTTDGGNSWELLSTPKVSQLASFDFLNENNGYLIGCSADQVYRTYNGGLTWEEQKITPAPNYFKSVNIYSDNVAFITDERGRTYQTTNGGKSWTIYPKLFRVGGLTLSNDEMYAFGGNGIIMKKNVTYPEITLLLYPATPTSATRAIIGGNVTSNGGRITNLRIEYGLDSLTNNSLELPDEVEPNGTLDILTRLTDLLPNRTYYYRLAATYNDKEYKSELLQFRTLTNYSYSNQKFEVSANDVYISDEITSNNKEISNIVYEYSEDDSYKLKRTPTPNFIPAGESKVITVVLDSLKPSTVYRVRILATYQDSTVCLRMFSFKTRSEYEISAGLRYNLWQKILFARLSVQSNSSTISNIELQYGTSQEYNNRYIFGREVKKGERDYFEAEIENLDSTAVYYFRWKANIGDKTIYTDEQTFTLKPNVVIKPIEHIELSDSSICLQGLLYHNLDVGYVTDFKVHYGLTEELTASVYAMLSRSNDADTLSAVLNNIIPDRTYYARFKAVYSETLGTIWSDLFTFKLKGTDVLELQDNLNIVVYPNPVTDYVFIKSDKNIDKMELFDATGNLVATSNENQLNLSGYSKGIYFIRVFIDNKTKTLKVLKQ